MIKAKIGERLAQDIITYYQIVIKLIQSFII